jgi:hypothetical protein
LQQCKGLNILQAMRLKACLNAIAAAYIMLAPPAALIAAELPAKHNSAVAWHFGPPCLTTDDFLTCQRDCPTRRSILTRTAQEEIDAIAWRRVGNAYSATVSHGNPRLPLTCPDRLC